MSQFSAYDEKAILALCEGKFRTSRSFILLELNLCRRDAIDGARFATVASTPTAQAKIDAVHFGKTCLVMPLPNTFGSG